MVELVSSNHGAYYIITGWVLTCLVVIAFTIRIYTRFLITKSAGSDDFAMMLPVPLSIAGEVLDTLAWTNGLGKHAEELDQTQITAIIKWEYLLWVLVFLSFFFIRCSVMLFTLRLLPPSKVWAARLIVLAFILNIAITVLAVVTWGIKCVPFPAIWENDPHAWCEATEITVITQQVNGGLACAIDIVTAIVPVFLLWNIQIKKTTRFSLDMIFLLGLITAALSIGRAVTFKDDIWTVDTSYRLIEPSTFSLFEEKFGIIFACGPAIRQFFVHLLKHGSPLPSNSHQPKDEDFHRMRMKVRLREVFWYKKPDQKTLANFSGAPLYPPEDMIDKKTKHLAEKDGKHSALDHLGNILKPFRSKGSFWRLGSTGASSTLPIVSKSSGHSSRKSPPQAWPGISTSREGERIASRYDAWEWPPNSSADDPERCDSAKPSDHSFLREDSQSSVPDPGNTQHTRETY